ncbi:MAG: hypothetical protein ACRD50_12145 [Candidatus Acidiferrales bacterium]
MNAKRLLGAIFAGFVILFMGGFVVHAVWLAPVYESMRALGFSFRPKADFAHKFWIIVVSDLLYTALFAWVYVRGREDKPWLGQGVRFGVLMTLFTVVPSALNDYMSYDLPYTLALKWMAAGLLVLVLMGIAVAGICKKSSA